MARVSKDPVVRRQEIVWAACDLFKEKGFEQVSVSDIVKKVGVAQGTFYYYFKTKYDILDAVMDLYMEKSRRVINGIAADGRLNALEKLQAIINYAIAIDPVDPMEKNFIEFLHSDENLVTHQKYLMRSFESAIDPLTRIIEEGVKSGLFDVRYPRETVEQMICMYGHLHDSLAIITDGDESYRKLRATEDILVRALGLKDGSIRLVPCDTSEIG